MSVVIDLCEVMIDGLEKAIPDQRRAALYPSSASITTDEGVVGDCLRKQYWYMKEEEKTNPFTKDGLIKMRFGDMVHEFVVEQCKKCGLWAADEQRIWDPRFQLSGRVDLYVYQGEDIVPIEIKSVAGYYGCMGVIKSNRNHAFAPKVDHVLQLLTYLDHYERYPVGDINFPYGMLFYIARDDGQRAQHIVKLTKLMENGEQVFEDIGDGGEPVPVTYPTINGEPWTHVTNTNMYKRWVKLAQAVAEDNLPDRDYTIQYSETRLKDMFEKGELNKADSAKMKVGVYVQKGDWRCGFCPYRDKCWNGLDSDDLFNGTINQNTPMLEE